MEPKSVTSGAAINPADALRTSQVGSDRAQSAGKKKANRQERDQSVGVSISESSLAASREKSKALDIARRTPDVREDRVSELKKRIASGNYKADAGQIADGMLREAIRDHLAKSDET